MEISVSAIPAEGREVRVNQEEVWVQHLIEEKLTPNIRSGLVLSGKIKLFKVQNNVSIHGKLQIAYPAECDACTESYIQEQEIPIVRFMSPGFEINHDAAPHERELNEDDLEYSSYSGDEIDVDDLITEEIHLALPLHYRCKEECRGLCPHCGQNLNQAQCQCQLHNELSPFAALKSLHFPSKEKK